MRMPAIVISDHRDRGVTQLGFARELRFLQIGHTDYVYTPTAVQVRFRFCRKLRAFNADVRAAELAVNSRAVAGSLCNSRHLRTNRIGECNMGDNALSKERRDAS